MKKSILVGVFVFIIFVCALLTNTHCQLYGDGQEYLEMIISLKNHLTPDLRLSDKIEAAYYIVQQTYPYMVNFETLQSGYFASPLGIENQLYSYHFWGYSLLCTPIFIILNAFHQYPIMAFTLTNLLLIILLFWWILFRNSAMNDKNKLFLTGLTFFSPLWFYYKWSHPEVFTFVLLFIGLLEYYNNRKKSAVFFTALSSIQNPAASIVPFFMLVKELISLIKDFNKQALKKFLGLSLISSIVIIPYIFYYIHFRKFSLIAEYMTDLKTISFAKISSLFFDLNFGLIIFVPVLLAIFIYLILKKDKCAIISAVTIILFAIIDAAQLNWNPGIMLIHRYSYWMIPVILFGCFNYFQAISDKKKLVILVLTILTITPWFKYCTNWRASMHVSMQPIAKIVLEVAPALYNPQEEVFIERALHTECGCDNSKLPIMYGPHKEIRKALYYDKNTKKYFYVNYPPSLKDIKIKIRHKKKVYYIGLDGITRDSK